ncbi:MAG: YesN8 [Paenibacillaceae bacterium]|jgi:two-component system response regulator YesN|nr:YesN8 [Paenibacillaceae bacterium]
MYQVLIVDDEPEIRLGIRMKADWEGLGLAIAGEAGNGAEALEMLSSLKIDIAITDMNMPLMNGVSFLENCRISHPELRIIVITGYEDFHYARAAVRSQARDYLLKPVSRDELEAALMKVTGELDELERQTSQRERLEWRLSQYYKEMKEHFILHIVKEEHGRLQGIAERAKLFELEDWQERAVRFVTAGIRERTMGILRDDGRTPDKLRLPFELICREFAEQSPEKPQQFLDPNYPGLMHFILPARQDLLESFAKRLKDCVSGHLQMEPAIGLGQAVGGFAEWREGYLSALLAWNLSDTKDRYPAKDYAEAAPVLSEESSNLLRKCLIRGDMGAFEQIIRKELTHAFGQSQAHLVKTIFQLSLEIEAAAQETGISLDSRGELWVRPELSLGLNTVGKAEQFLVRMGRQILQTQAAAKDQTDSDRTLFQAVKQFIEDHYMYDLSLTMLAERFNYHPSYFSELFKSKIGKTFIQYVTEIRMSQAVRLLEETALPLWDVAELTGFANASYFSSKFKRMYGISPSDYRQQKQGRPYEEIDSELPKK